MPRVKNDVRNVLEKKKKMSAKLKRKLLYVK